MIEHSLLKAFCVDREHFVKYGKFVDVEYLKQNYITLYKIYNIINILYTKHGNESISQNELVAGYLASYPVLKTPERVELEKLVATIFKAEMTESLLATYLETHRQRAFAGDLALKALAVAEGRGNMDDLSALWRAYSVRGDILEVEYVEDDLETLYERVAASGGLSWPWDCLQRSLGPLRKGNFGFVFARPEAGKTTWLSHFVTHVASQPEVTQPILWFNNEQVGEEVQVRLYQSCLGKTVQELFADRKTHTKQFKQATKGLIRIKDDAIISNREIEAICEQEQPSLIIFDQIDKVHGFTDDRYDLELGKRYQWARELAKQYCPVIGTTQSDVSGENVKYLTMENVANAKTAKQAEADWILGIGWSSKDGFPWYRYFNISKNKLMGDENTVPSERHGRYQLVLDPEIGRYRELGEQSE